MNNLYDSVRQSHTCFASTWIPLVTRGVGFNPVTDTTNGKLATIVNAELDRVRLRYHIYETNISGNFALTTYIDLLKDPISLI